MSTKAINWAFNQQGLQPTLKIVLIAMADFAGPTGMSFASRETLCQFTGHSKPDTISSAQSKLVDMGLLKDTGRRTGSTGKIPVYQFPEEACVEVPKAKPNHPSNGLFNHPPDGLLPTVQSPANHPLITRLTEVPNIKEQGTRNGAGETHQPAAKSPKRELTDGWCAKWQAHHGMPYKFEGAKDGRAADRLLALALSPADILAIAEQAWRHPDWFNCKQAATLAGFECRFNDIRLELKNPPGQKRPQSNIQPLTAPRVVNGNY